MVLANDVTAVVCAYHTVGYRCLDAILGMGARVLMVFTHEDSPTESIWFPSVRQLAEERGVPCCVTDISLPENRAVVQDLAPDLIFSFYYRNMIKNEVLNIPRAGALNVHGSYLPKYRGRVPVNWVVINGENETGASLHYMVEKPDAGDIVDQERVPIAFTDTALDVFNKVADAAVKVICRSYPLLAAGTAPRLPMDLAMGSYFGGRKPADGLIPWRKSAIEIYNLIRGVTHPYPGAFTYLNGRKVTIWQAWPVSGLGEPGRIISVSPFLVGTGDGLLEIRSLEREGEREVSATEFVTIYEVAGRYFNAA